MHSRRRDGGGVGFSVREQTDTQHQAGPGLVDRVHNLVCLCQGPRIDYINPAGREMLAIAEDDDVRGKAFADFYHADYTELAEFGFDDLAQEAMPISIKFLAADGRALDTEMWISPIDGDDRYLLEVRDISDHLRSARLLRQREQRLEGIISTVANGIVSLDARGDIIAFNPAAEAIFGYAADAVIGKQLDFLVTPEQDDDTGDDSGDDMWWKSALGEISELEGQRQSGEKFVIEMDNRLLQQGDQVTYTGVVRDITERKRLEARVHTMAHFDSITSLPNRNLLADRLAEAAKRAERSGNQLALMYVDLNKFKPINDELGHDAGDLALKTMAQRMSESVRQSDTVARVGGDEFVILLENVASSDIVCEIADKVLVNIERPIDFSGEARSIGAAIGIALFPDHGADTTALMQCADKAMYEAKAVGKSCHRMAKI